MNITNFITRSKRNERIANLRTIVDRIRFSNTLDDIPDRIAAVLEAFDQSDISPDYRADIHDVLSTAITIAHGVSSPAFDSQSAILAIIEQQTILAKLLMFLSQRPERIGYSILIPATKTLIGQFATEEEAGKQLLALSSFGSIKHAVVVPVRISSMFNVRPSTIEQPSAEEQELPRIFRNAEEAANMNPDVLMGVLDNKITDQPIDQSTNERSQ